ARSTSDQNLGNIPVRRVPKDRHRRWINRFRRSTPQKIRVGVVAPRIPKVCVFAVFRKTATSSPNGSRNRSTKRSQEFSTAELSALCLIATAIGRRLII